MLKTMRKSLSPVAALVLIVGTAGWCSGEAMIPSKSLPSSIRTLSGSRTTETASPRESSSQPQTPAPARRRTNIPL
jgi:hypothetical protein